jgi:hypothetical protein
MKRAKATRSLTTRKEACSIIGVLDTTTLEDQLRATSTATSTVEASTTNTPLPTATLPALTVLLTSTLIIPALPSTTNTLRTISNASPPARRSTLLSSRLPISTPTASLTSLILGTLPISTMSAIPTHTDSPSQTSTRLISTPPHPEPATLPLAPVHRRTTINERQRPVERRPVSSWAMEEGQKERPTFIVVRAKGGLGRDRSSG